MKSFSDSSLLAGTPAASGSLITTCQEVVTC